MITLNLTQGLTDNDQYKAFKFPGGEIHLKFKSTPEWQDAEFKIITRLNTSDDIIFLILAVDTLKKDWSDNKLSVYIPYMPYQQADRDFSVGECFSLATIVNLLCAIPVDFYTIYDPHSDVSAGFFRMANKNIKVIDNSEYIKSVVASLSPNLTLLSPDAGAYKKIYKLADKIQFKGEVASANKSRSISTGNIDSLELSKEDFEGKDILIVDDICVGGRTFVELAKKLRERNVGNLYLAISHGIFSNGFIELAKYFQGVFTTNSRRDSYDLYGDRKEITVGEIIPDNFLSVYNIF